MPVKLLLLRVIAQVCLSSHLLLANGNSISNHQANTAPQDFTYVDVGSFTSTQAPDGENIYTLTFSATTVAGSSLNFALPQLFHSTFKNRINGLRSTVAQAINNIGGSFLRFPGGNNIEGESFDTRWKWNETIGPLENRPGRDGDWKYPNTDALGLIEYLHWCEDMNLTPILAIWAGYSLDKQSITGEALTPYVDDVLAELEVKPSLS